MGDHLNDFWVTATHLFKKIDWLFDSICRDTVRKISFESKYAEHDHPESALHEQKQVGEDADYDRSCVPAFAAMRFFNLV